MNFITYTILSIYIIAMIYLFIKFKSNNLDLSETILSIKKDLKKIFKCCINKKNIEEKISKEKADELEEKINNLDTDCKEPFGVPLDVCLSGELTEEEIVVREKVINILSKKDLTVKNGGKDKLVVPMQAMLFLTKNLNPLVSEKGDITIKITSEMGHFKNLHKKEINEKELLEQLVIKMKDKDSILYQDDPEYIDMLNNLILKEKQVVKEVIPEKQVVKEVIPEKQVVKEVIPEKQVVKEVIPEKQAVKEVKTIYNEEEENIDIATIEGPDEEDIKTYSKKEEKIEQPEEIIFKKIEVKNSPFDADDEEKTFSMYQNNDSDEEYLDINAMLLNELDSIELEEEDENEQFKDFYSKLEYKTIENFSLNKDNITESIKELFNKHESISCLFKNIAKAQPLIFNPNKTVCIIDQNIILFAIAKMFGFESKVYIDLFKKLNKESLRDINSIITNKLDLYLSDLLSGDKKPTYYLVQDSNENKFYTFGFVFQTNSFKNAFQPEEFDYFRSFPFNSKYEFIKKATKEESNNASALIMDIKDVEIK